MRRQIGACGTVAACLLFLPLPAVAQQDAQAEDEKLPQFTEEITVRVTARKREENLQSVPFSVAAPSPQVLRTRGAESLEDVSVNVAGFSVQNLGPGQSQIAMRGVSAGQIVRDQPGVKEQVGVYLDESVISLSLFTPDLDLFDMSRIEVLRGTAGDAVWIGLPVGHGAVHHEPAGNRRHRSGGRIWCQLDGGRRVRQRREIRGQHSARRGDGRPRHSLSHGYRGLHGRRAARSEPQREPSITAAAPGAHVALRLQPNEQFSITPRLHYQDVAMDGWNRIDAYNILANPYTTTRPAITLGARQHFTQIEEPFADTFLLGDVTVAYDFGGVAVTAITSLTTRDVQVVRDATALGASVSFSPFGAPEAGYTLDMPLIDETTATGLTQELRVASDTERVLGAFYSTASASTARARGAEDYVAVNSGAVSDFLRGRDGAPGSLLGGLPDPGGPPRHGRTLFLRSHLRLQSARAVRGGLAGRHRPVQPDRRSPLVRLRRAAHPDVRRPVCRSARQRRDDDGSRRRPAGHRQLRHDRGDAGKRAGVEGLPPRRH